MSDRIALMPRFTKLIECLTKTSRLPSENAKESQVFTSTIDPNT
jgi:hypothetical protein